jgi:3-deoxy-D-manno-octulosonic-acid transferase
MCSIPLIKRLKAELPGCNIVITTMTRTGNVTAQRQIPEAAEILFLPWDYPLILNRFLRKMDPAFLLVAETELWPNLLRLCRRKKVPVALFNGRISDRSFPGYWRFRSLFGRPLEAISLFLMQTEKDRQRIVEIGARLERTRVTGNIKFDQPFPASAEEAKARMAASLGLRGHEKILIAGSTHPGEEEILLGLYRDLLEIIPDLILVLCPRHLDRLEQVESILQKEKRPWVRRTALSTANPLPGEGVTDNPPVVLLDTMGELMNLYSLGTLVFIGGSLVPVGGHNPLEPLWFGKCVFFGPYMFNFLEISRLLIEASGAIQVKDRAEFLFQAKRLLQEEGMRKEMGERGHRVLQSHRGATERILSELRPLLKEIADRRL